MCGEFVSGRGAQLLVGLFPELPGKGVTARTVQFHADGRSSKLFQLPAPGLSVARWDLDHVLAKTFAAAGGELLTKRRWTESFQMPGVVRATGRRIDASGQGWTGLKAHVKNWKTAADLEMHFSDNGYIGIARLTAGANICALVRANFPSVDFRRDPRSALAQLIKSESESSALFSGAQIDPASCCAVAGISLQTKNSGDECCVGDSIQMIPPFTGNGMSLAIESAFLAAEPLMAYASGWLEWSRAVHRVNYSSSRAFRGRLCAASFLARIAHRSWTRRLMLSCLRTVPQLFSMCFAATR